MSPLKSALPYDSMFKTEPSTSLSPRKAFKDA